MSTLLDSAKCIEFLGLPDTAEIVYAKFMSNKLKQKTISESIADSLPNINILRGSNFNDSAFNRYKTPGGNILLALNKTGTPNWSFGALVVDSTAFKKEFSKMVLERSALAVTKKFIECNPSPKSKKSFTFEDYYVENNLITCDLRDVQLYLSSCMTKVIQDANFDHHVLTTEECSSTKEKRHMLSSEDAISLIVRCLS